MLEDGALWQNLNVLTNNTSAVTQTHTAKYIFIQIFLNIPEYPKTAKNIVFIDYEVHLHLLNLFSDNCGYRLYFLILILYTSNSNTLILS